MDNQLPIKAAEGSRKVLYLIVGIVILCAGFLIGYAVGGSGTMGNKGYAAGWEAARQKIAETEIFGTPHSVSLSGTVLAVNKDSIEIDVPNMNRNPLEPVTPATRKVTVGSETEIYLATPMSDEELIAAENKYMDDFEEWRQAIEEGEEIDMPERPNEYNLEKTDLSKITAGMRVTVIADEDIISSESFEAIKINVID